MGNMAAMMARMEAMMVQFMPVEPKPCKAQKLEGPIKKERVVRTCEGAGEPELTSAPADPHPNRLVKKTF